MTEYGTITSAANDRMEGWMRLTLADGNTTAASVNALMTALHTKEAVMTPGIMVRRALQQNAPQLLPPELREKAPAVWSSSDVDQAAAVMERVFGQLCEKKGRGMLSWKAVLNCELSTGGFCSSAVLYKIAICLRLHPVEVTKLFLLNNRARSAHNLLDVVFTALQEHFPDNLSWQMIMEVLQACQETGRFGNVPYNVLVENAENHTGTIIVQDMLENLSKNTEGEDAYKETLVKTLAENAEYFTSFTLTEDPKYDGCPLAGSVKVTGYTYSVNGARALRTMLRVLTALYGDILTQANSHEICFKGYETVNGYPKELTNLFNSMFSYIGAYAAADTPAEQVPALMKYLQKIVSGLVNDIVSTAKVLEGRLPRSRTITHADILTLTYFLILGLNRLETEKGSDAVLELDSKVKEEKDLFAANFGAIRRSVQNLYRCNKPDQRLTYAKNTYDLVLRVFGESGMKDVFELYLPLPLDSVLLAAVTCADDPADWEALMDFVDFALHPDALQDAESAENE